MKKFISGWVGIALVLLMVGARAAEPSQAPSAVAVLADLGYTEDAYQILTAWNECPKHNGEMIYGVHVAARDGSEPFDLYYDASGKIIDAKELAALGVTQKRWGWKSITKAAEKASVSQAKHGEAVRPVLKSLGVTPPGFELGIPDVEAARQEDEWVSTSGEKGPLRIGVFQDIAAPIRVYPGRADAGVWHETADGGWVWAVTLNAPGAEGLRIHFSHAMLIGASLSVYNAADSSESYGPFTQAGDFWAPTCFSGAVTVEYYVSSLSRFSDEELLVEIDRTTYQYRSLDSLQKGVAAWCHNDLSCEGETWKNIGSAVGGLGTINADGAIWCTGTLLLSPEDSLFLTANHCVNTVGTADALEIYWRYGSTACNDSSTVPEPASVPRTVGGADYLVGSSLTGGTDVTLLRLHGVVPGDLFHIDFSSETRAVGTPVTCIHQPQGDYKRVSFGTMTNQGSPSGVDLPLTANFYRVLWNSGTTEPGSSGSPLFYDAPDIGPIIIGQLYGGGASCDEANEPDCFGRSDVSYPLLDPWINGSGGSEHTVTISVEGSGSVQITGSPDTFTQKTLTVGDGMTLGLGAVPDSGFALKGWRVDDATTLVRSTPVEVTVTGDLRVTAVFRAKTFLVCGAGLDGSPYSSRLGDRWIFGGTLLFLVVASTWGIWRKYV